MTMPSSAPPPPSWIILGAIPRVSTDLSLDLAAPPRVSLLTIPKRIFPADEGVTNPPRILAADPSGLLLLLHADQGRATGPTVIDRPNHPSFCWRQFVAGYFVLNAADADADAALPLPEPELIMNASHLGIIASPTAYMVAELQPFVGDDHATLLCFSSDVGEWVDKTVSYPLQPRPFSSHAVLSLHGRLWWVDLSWCILACDPFADNPRLDVLQLPPPAKPLNYGQAAGVLDRYRAVGVSDGKLRFVDMYRNRDPTTGALQVTVWTLPDPDST
ncbi:hypothetical protein PVAP13_5KG454000 [Panicum virgatum]|uniref:DUF1618 domain-containing protein n=1 Tax=Panicum virgatum TaxID=38727 RepID=A0A8T0SLH4_PANVG|nr:hypothetical protein PVAP13_5KG454000 [Panicum virgatum]